MTNVLFFHYKDKIQTRDLYDQISTMTIT